MGTAASAAYECGAIRPSVPLPVADVGTSVLACDARNPGNVHATAVRWHADRLLTPAAVAP